MSLKKAALRSGRVTFYFIKNMLQNMLVTIVLDYRMFMLTKEGAFGGSTLVFCNYKTYK